MNQELILDLLTKVDTLWSGYLFDGIWSLIALPFEIVGLIALYKINQVLKIYIENNKDFL